MTKIAVFSDSHGDVSKLVKAIKENEDVSAIVHLGDCARDAYEAEKITGKSIIKLNGNCDILSNEPVFHIFQIEGVRIYLTHGHREHVKMGLLRLGYKAEEENARLALYGHTHIPKADEFASSLLVNPGALKDGKYLIITLNDGAILPEFKSVEG